MIYNLKYIHGLAPVSGIGAPKTLDIFSVVRVTKLSFAVLIRWVLGSTSGLGRVDRGNNEMIRWLELSVSPQPPSGVGREAGG